MPISIEIDHVRITEFCRKRQIRELSLFGSVLRNDFGPESDLDILVDLGPDTSLDLFDWMDMEEELCQMLGRPVDLLEKTGIKNPYRRRSILGNREIVYAAD